MEERELISCLLNLVLNRDRLLESGKQKEGIACQSLQDLGRKNDLWEGVREFGTGTSKGSALEEYLVYVHVSVALRSYL